jgi:hypothetical protein
MRVETGEPPAPVPVGEREPGASPARGAYQRPPAVRRKSWDRT